MSEAKRIFLHALTAVHSGTGQGASVIDLPIAREKATGWPVLPASGLKGVLRDAIQDQDKDWTDAAFGKGGKGVSDEEMTAGQICLTDPQILCLPIRSFFGTFAYVTCPLALTRYSRNARALGVSGADVDGASVSGDQILIAKDAELVRDDKQTVYLEDLDLKARVDDGADRIAADLASLMFTIDAEKQAFARRFAIVSDEVFTFLSETATEVAARVRLEDDSKTVTNGGLWYEEAIPAEAIFCGIAVLAVHANRNGEHVTLDELKEKLETIKVIQVGGKSSIGRGLCRVVVA